MASLPDHRSSKIREIANELFCIISDRPIANGAVDMFSAARSARDLYALRRKRDDLFDASIFGEPAWDILLDLYTADISGAQISITSACIAAAAPATTALRWINVLLDQGMIERFNDNSDGRRSFLRLTSETRTKLDSLLGVTLGERNLIAG